MVEKVIAVHSGTYGLVFCTATATWTVEEFISHLADPHESRYEIREIWEADYPENSRDYPKDCSYSHMMDILIEKDKNGTAYTEFDFFWNDKNTMEWVD